MGIKVFFNNSCKVCRLEINHYKKISNSDLEWIDITDNDQALKLTSKNKKELLRRLHVIDDGKVIGGAKAFVIIWSKIPKYKFLSKLMSIKPLFIIFHYFYEIAAYLLFLKNKSQLKWKKIIYLQKFVLFAKDHLIGERNGGLIGQTLYIVQKNVLKINKNLNTYFI